MMRVLVSAASKYGSTTEIAEAIGKELSAAGHDVDVRPPADVSSIESYDAVVLGSAVYVGHWLEPVHKLIEREREALRQRPVWLFSSGPIGEPPMPKGDDAVGIADIVEATAAREHHIFNGKLDKHRLSFPERAVVFALRVAEGDFRDWDAVASWARGIAAALNADSTG
jgi:menaquinone-dependent protoporphyrinogen oxidase